MPYDFNTIGTQFAQNIPLGFEMADRRVRRRAEEADRQIKERLVAQQIAQIDLENQKLKEDLALRAQQDADWLDITSNVAKARAANETFQASGQQGPVVPEEEALLQGISQSRFPESPHIKATIGNLAQIEQLKATRALAEQRGTTELEAEKLRSEIDLNKARRVELLQGEPEFVPEVRTIKDPKTGRDVSLVRTSKNAWSEINNPSSVSSFGKMIQERQTALSKGDTETVRLYDEQFAGKGWNLQFDDQGRVIGMSQGPVKAPTLPQAMVSRLTERMNQSLEGITALSELQTDVRWKDVGAPGVLGEMIFDTALPMLGIPTGDVRRMATRQKIITTREGLIRDMSGDTRFNIADRRAVEEALPSSGVITTKERLQEAAQVTKQVLAKRAALDAIDLRLLPPKWATDNMTDRQLIDLAKVDVLTPEKLLAMVESGSLSKERAISIWQAANKARR